MDVKILTRPHIDIKFTTKDMKIIWNFLFNNIPDAEFHMDIDLYSCIKPKYLSEETNPWSQFKLILSKKRISKGCFSYNGTISISVPTGKERYPQDIYSFSVFDFNDNDSPVFHDLLAKFMKSLIDDDNCKIIAEGSIKAYNHLISITYDFHDGKELVVDDILRVSKIHHGVELDPTSKIVRIS